MKKITQKNIKIGHTILALNYNFVVIKIKDIYIYRDIDGKNKTFFDCNFFEKNCHYSNKNNFPLSGQKMKDLVNFINQSKKFKIK